MSKKELHYYIYWCVRLVMNEYLHYLQQKFSLQ
jgi:hypothetical protein